ncbi:MAG: prepilin-type N-terminal cleavage/methylation domain-containing protein [Acidobacteria bacterium]|nr:MAG: prepilin-type N-terminal cleavage/methylation domain-containing protein [Acidobacteriota bacterium]
MRGAVTIRRDARAWKQRLPAGASAQAGWTLIELLVVMSLIAVLATLALAQYRNSIRATREAVLKADLFHMRESIDQYYADKGSYPSSLQTLVSEGYLRRIPVDPITNSADTWVTTQAELDPSAATSTPGIYDVKSGADGISTDGTRYADW